MVFVYMLQFIFGLIIWMIRSAFMSIYLFFAGPPVGTVVCIHCSEPMHFRTDATLNDQGVVSSVVWSEDGKYLAIGHSQETKIDIYDTKNWNLIGSIIGQEPSQHSLARFVDNNQDLILPRDTGAPNGLPLFDNNVSIVKWNIVKHTVDKKFYTSFSNDKNSFEFSKPFTPDFIARASKAAAVAASADGRYVAASVATGIIIYDSETAQVIQNIKCADHFVSSIEPYTLRYNAPDAIAFNPENTQVLLGDCDTNYVSAYDINSGSLIYRASVRYQGGGDVLAYSSDGTLIAVGSSGVDGGKLTIIRASDGSIVGSSPNESADISNVQWLPGRSLVLVSYDALYGVNWDTGASLEYTNKSDARIWDAKTLSLVAEFRGSQLGAAAFSPDGKQLAIGSSTDNQPLGKPLIGSVLVGTIN